MLKLFFGVQGSPEIPIGHLERMMERERTLLHEFRRIEHEEIAQSQQYPDAPYWKMAARFGQWELDAHLRWAEETLTELRKIARKQRSSAKRRKEKSHAEK